jgi:hypothetical protein
MNKFLFGFLMVLTFNTYAADVCKITVGYLNRIDVDCYKYKMNWDELEKLENEVKVITKDAMTFSTVISVMEDNGFVLRTQNTTQYTEGGYFVRAKNWTVPSN